MAVGASDVLAEPREDGVASVGLERDPVPALLAIDIPKLELGH